MQCLQRIFPIVCSPVQCCGSQSEKPVFIHKNISSNIPSLEQKLTKDITFFIPTEQVLMSLWTMQESCTPRHWRTWQWKSWTKLWTSMSSPPWSWHRFVSSTWKSLPSRVLSMFLALQESFEGDDSVEKCWTYPFANFDLWEFLKIIFENFMKIQIFCSTFFNMY